MRELRQHVIRDLSDRWCICTKYALRQAEIEPFASLKEALDEMDRRELATKRRMP